MTHTIFTDTNVVLTEKIEVSIEFSFRNKQASSSFGTTNLTIEHL
ncbi:hypothetical protein [Sphingobacterium suaedae]|uniref:Uncharacterized protein n=1 Tax=Sphingobacterium suaedae TaxID=1686402 RepID=A0ABW5KED3_9SPHI